MNEQFRIAHKTGLMFRNDEEIPKNIETWLTQQLIESSPALGIPKVPGNVAEWPDELQPDLNQRAMMWRRFKALDEQAERGINGQDSEAAKRANDENNKTERLDEHKFVHRNVYGADQVKLRLTAFWANHFTTGNVGENGNAIGHAIDEGILGKLDGDFSNLLYGMITHPAMLRYLDNVDSAGERSNRVKWERKDGRQAGLNDNLGRELLELHTVSVNAGYIEKDIKGAANVLAGWGSYFSSDLRTMREETGNTDHWNSFKKDWHEPGNKTVLGKKIYSGRKGLRQLTDFLASHESTINHLSIKLAQHFVSDEPTAEQIQAIENVWRSSGGDLPKIHLKVLQLASESMEPKFVWPMTWLFQVVRLSGATYFKGWKDIYNDDDRLMDTQQVLTELGQSFWSRRQPDGYSSEKAEWLSSEMFERRVRFADAIYQQGDPQLKQASMIMARIGASKETQALVASVGSSGRDQFIALMCSPELMGLKYV